MHLEMIFLYTVSLTIAPCSARLPKAIFTCTSNDFIGLITGIMIILLKLPLPACTHVNIDILIFAEYCIHCLQLTGQVDECCCDVESVDTLNKNRIYPIISSVVKQTFFKFFKVRNEIYF